MQYNHPLHLVLTLQSTCADVDLTLMLELQAALTLSNLLLASGINKPHAITFASPALSSWIPCQSEQSVHRQGASAIVFAAAWHTASASLRCWWQAVGARSGAGQSGSATREEDVTWRLAQLWQRVAAKAAVMTVTRDVMNERLLPINLSPLNSQADICSHCIPMCVIFLLYVSANRHRLYWHQ